MPLSSEPRTPEEIERWAHQRLPHERETVPVPGERLLFRQHDFGETVLAEVVAVQDMSSPNDHWGSTAQPDPNVWEADGSLKQDPWPWVRVLPVRLGADGNEIPHDERSAILAARWCKESRVRGSAGWLREGSRSHTGIYEESAG